jgi:hypothetical protein
MKAILVFSHEHNTFDKRKMLDNPHPDYFKESPKTVDMFIRKKDESRIKSFFMKEIDAYLAAYEPGLPKMKPDVLKQIKEIEAEREVMIQEEMKKMNNQPITLQRPGQEPVQLSNVEIVSIINNQQEQIRQLQQQQSNAGSQQLQPFIEKLKEAEKIINMLQKQLIEKTRETIDLKAKIKTLESNTTTTRIPIQYADSPVKISKTDPEIIIDVNSP